MTKITCKCVLCGSKRVYTDDDKIDEGGPMCEKCIGPMIVENIERNWSDIAQERCRQLRGHISKLESQLAVSEEFRVKNFVHVCGMQRQINERDERIGKLNTDLEIWRRNATNAEVRNVEARSHIIKLETALREISDSNPSPTALDPWVRWAMNKAFDTLYPIPGEKP